MKKDSVSIMEKIYSDLLIPPHIVNKLVDIITGEWKLDVLEAEKIIAHLDTCSDCRTALNGLLAVVEQYEKSNGDAEATHQILTQFVTAHDQIEAQRYEQIGAYADTIVTKGKEVADKQFPELAEHMKSCLKCKTILETILAVLREDEEAD